MAIELARPAPRTQITKAVLRLRELIFNGRYSPGERMAELPLVELLLLLPHPANASSATAANDASPIRIRGMR